VKTYKAYDVSPFLRVKDERILTPDEARAAMLEPAADQVGRLLLMQSMVEHCDRSIIGAMPPLSFPRLPQPDENAYVE
jgi:hypothetical protein